MQDKDKEFVLTVIEKAVKEMIANGCMTTSTYLQLLECERILLAKQGRKPKAKAKESGD